MKKLKDKVVIVTGAAGGLGRALALELGHHGARLALIDRDEEGLLETGELLAYEGIYFLTVTGDVTRNEDCKRLIGRVHRRWKRLDILINNAGITHRSLFENTEMDVLRQVMEVNYFGSLNFTRATLPDLLESRGMIVVLSSVAGLGPLLGRSGYCASKFAVAGFFDTLREELRQKGVRVMVVFPGFIDTGIEPHALGGDGRPAAHARSITGKIMAPEKAAKVIVRGIRNNRRRLMVTSVAHTAWWISRLFPNLYAWFMHGKFRSELEKH